MTAPLRRFAPIIALMIVAFSEFSYAQFSDQFTDLDLSNDPTWTGDINKFIINTDTVLQLNDGVAGQAQLVTSFAAYDLNQSVEWQFWIQQGFSGSASNYGRVYLVSDQTDLFGPLNGYYLQFGEALAVDAIELFRQSGTTSTSVCRGTDGLIANSFSMKIRVRRDAAGNWEVSTDPSGGTSFATQATGTDVTHTSSTSFGMRCTYTASNANKFYYDNIYMGPYINDVTAPEATSVTVISPNALDVRFSEAVSASTAENTANYNGSNGINSPITAVLDGADATLVHLTFAGTFANGSAYDLTVSNVQDLAANTMTTTVLPFQYVVTEAAAFRDIVINEFMADETPSQGLPETEYVELFNRSTKFIDLTGWKLADNSSEGTIGTLVLGPGEFALLVPTSGVALFPFTQRVVGVTSWASLNNSGDAIILKDTGLVVVDQLTYTDAWYGDPFKEDGGFSLEQINPYRSCTASSNWLASNNANGGTAGSVNSIFNDTPDVTGPSVIGVQVLEADRVELLLSEPIAESSVSASAVGISPVAIIANAAGMQPELTSVNVQFATPLDTAVLYTITISGLTDCEGNAQAGNNAASFLIPFDLRPGDLIINEVLADPVTGGKDYVELYNRSDRPVNLRNCALANFSDDTISSIRIITLANYAVLPQGYVCLTQDSVDIIGKYISHGIGNFIQMSSLPSYNIDSGTVFLLAADSAVLERFAYDEDMHFALLDDSKGFSLERLDPERDVNDRGNWHSAAQTVGGGTPGLKNSQFYLTAASQGEVTTDPAIFSPDSDGLQDVLNINYRFEATDMVGTIRIFDANGREVRLLIANQLLATEGVFTWDGTTDEGTKTRIGPYIILFETFEPSGSSHTYKLTTVLGGKL
jgi:hypothetical protein